MENKSAAIKPEILAPAGDMNCFLAALAAGADAVYLGLKHFSARMEAENFTLAQLSAMVALAHAENRKVYVAMNTLIKPGELGEAHDLVYRVAKTGADGLIAQDMCIPELARQAGFRGSIVFSTLANVSFPAGLKTAAKMGASRVVVPRELSLDGMKEMGSSCPPGLDLECFVHGALCYCVSGRCYWSSYMGGRSGLRGRCAQPCRRVYKNISGSGRPGGGQKGSRFFSCQDLEIGVLVKTLLKVPDLVSWKIEGRKKGPHYVYHVVTAYRILRDFPNDPKMRAMALEILEMALGRPGVKAGFLSQRPVKPMLPDGETGSGLLAGKVTLDASGKPQFKPRLPLLPGDLLRVGAQDERWHAIVPVKRAIPKRASFILNLPRHKTPALGTPVYLVDRREKDLEKLLAEWQARLEAMPVRESGAPARVPRLPGKAKAKRLPDMAVLRALPERWAGGNGRLGLWLNEKTANAPERTAFRAVWWLPPDIWPETEEFFAKAVKRLMEMGANDFVCNAPWQRSLFPENPPAALRLVAGPFCNLANGLAMQAMANAGFAAAFASPELSGADLLALPAQSPLPLGLVLSGFFPAGISRFGLSGLEPGNAFQSPKGEIFWTASHMGTTWIFPAWPLDLSARKKDLEKAGYSFFAQLREKPPANLAPKERPGVFNWDAGLL